MKISSLKKSFVGLAISGVLFLKAANAQIMLNDFQNSGFDFAYDSFTGNITQNPTFISINATEQGGAGSTVSLDLSSYYPSGQIQIEARLIAGNAADNFNVILFTTPDPGGIKSGYQFSTASLNTSTFTTLTANLNAPTFFSGTMDWSSIVQYQLQGDYSTTDNFRIEFRNLQVVPEPAAVVIALLGLGGLVVARRIRSESHLTK